MAFARQSIGSASDGVTRTERPCCSVHECNRTLAIGVEHMCERSCGIVATGQQHPEKELFHRISAAHHEASTASLDTNISWSCGVDLRKVKLWQQADRGEGLEG